MSIFIALPLFGFVGAAPVASTRARSEHVDERHRVLRIHAVGKEQCQPEIAGPQRELATATLVREAFGLLDRVHREPSRALEPYVFLGACVDFQHRVAVPRHPMTQRRRFDERTRAPYELSAADQNAIE